MTGQELLVWEVNWRQKTAHLTHRVLSQGAGSQMASSHFHPGPVYTQWGGGGAGRDVRQQSLHPVQLVLV